MSFFRSKREKAQRKRATDEGALSQCIEAPPEWLVGRGLKLLVVGFTLGLIALLALPSPERVEGPVEVRTRRAPERIVAQSDGRLARVWVAEGQEVHEGERLAVIESAADADAVLRLSDAIRHIESVTFDTRFITLDAKEARSLKQQWAELIQRVATSEGELRAEIRGERRGLGSLEVPFAAYQTGLEAYLEFVLHERLTRQARAVRQTLRRRASLDERMNAKVRLAERGAELTQSWVEGDTPLSSSGALSQRDADTTLLEQLQRQEKTYSQHIERVLNRVAVSGARQALAEVEQRRFERRQELSLAVRRRALELRGALDSWRRQYLLSARQDGRVGLLSQFAEGVYVKSGEALLAIVPEDTALVGYARIEQKGIGRLQEGQLARLHFAAFPVMRFGYVPGRVAKVSAIGDDKGYLVEIAIESLRTHTTQELDFRQGMQGTVHVISERLTLFERLLGPLRYAWHTDP